MTFKIRKKLPSTKLKMFEASKWAAGNSSVLIQQAAQAIDITTSTSAACLSARNGAVDIAHALEDYACKDYPCMTLDGIAATCDGVAAVVAFIPGCSKIFAITTASSCFCRTLRNKCKEAKGLLRCN